MLYNATTVAFLNKRLLVHCSNCVRFWRLRHCISLWHCPHSRPSPSLPRHNFLAVLPLHITLFSCRCWELVLRMSTNTETLRNALVVTLMV